MVVFVEKCICVMQNFVEKCICVMQNFVEKCMDKSTVPARPHEQA